MTRQAPRAMTVRVCATHGAVLFRFVAQTASPYNVRRRVPRGSLWACTFCGAAGTLPAWARGYRR